MFSPAKVEFLSLGARMALREPLFYRYAADAAFAVKAFFFAATMLGLAVACIAAMAASMVIVWKASKSESYSPWGFFALAWIVSALVFVFLYAFDDGRSTIDHLGTDVFKLAVDKPWTKLGYPSDLRTWIKIANGLASGGAVFVALCICTLAPPPLPTALNETGETKVILTRAAQEIEERVRSLKYLLFWASAILVTGVANMQAWRDWPTLVLDKWDKATSAEFKQLAAASVGYDSFLFFLILVAMFLPMAVWLQSSAQKLGESAAEYAIAESAANWLSSKGLTLSFNEMAQRLIAVLSPILAAPILELVKALALLGQGGL
ncbi:MAG: hypothetical protein HYW28_11055 [Rhodospirillales bacterium]|nr:hypothetical protein [Rhodospirillales bacterium]